MHAGAGVLGCEVAHLVQEGLFLGSECFGQNMSQKRKATGGEQSPGAPKKVAFSEIDESEWMAQNRAAPIVAGSQTRW